MSVPESKLPRHVAIIMDGNGRWAKRRGQPRILGHRQGAESVRLITEESARLGIQQLTLYSFSIENWKRPADEVAQLMSLYVEFLAQQLPTMQKNNIRFRQIGRQEGLSPEVIAAARHATEITAKNTGLILCLAINYGSRQEITDAVREIARKVQQGLLTPDTIDEDTISEHLYTAGMADPDLLIRTAGELRVSNYLLWQISYAELYVAEKCWPDFGVEELHAALASYAQRQRKYGAIEPKV
jgi:undecaprenyl diphosphate synthase